MQPVDYDAIAADYDRRYARYDFSGIAAALRSFLSGASQGRVLEVGCGTGHWLAQIGAAHDVVGVDPSSAMLRRARRAAPGARVLRATAEALPLRDRCVDRVFFINALHHVRDLVATLAGCRRVLRPGGGFLSIGLDPHSGADRWWVYDRPNLSGTPLVTLAKTRSVTS